MIKNIWVLAKSGFLAIEKKSLKETIFLGLKLYGILMLLKLVSFGVYYLMVKNDIYNVPTNISGDGLRSYNPILQILKIAVLAPIIEELIFRLGLKFSKPNLIISLAESLLFGI